MVILAALIGGLAVPISAAHERPTGSILAAAAPTCAPPASTSPSSVLIPTAPPTGSLAAGDRISAGYEVQIVNPPKHVQTVDIYVPAFYATFYGAGASKIQLYFHPGWVHEHVGGWSAPTTLSQSSAGAFTFGSPNATFSSIWLAIMSNASYGSWAVQFQWHWTLTPTTGHATNGPWSHPIRSSTSRAQPTTFYPAPYVQVVSTTPLKGAPAGSTFTANLSGNVSSTALRMLLETPAGKELNSVCLVTPSGSTLFGASIPLSYSNGTNLPSGTYGLHLHNAGGAIVVFLRVSVA